MKVNTTEIAKHNAEKLEILKQKDALQLLKIVTDIESGKNVFLHGPGGTGKSYTIRALYSLLKLQDKEVSVTATTGIAAVTLGNNEMPVSTLHSFAGVGLGDSDVKYLIQKVRSSGSSKRVWERCDVLIIDEVSMLGGRFFTKLDLVAKAIRNNYLPFGGIQLIMSGDFMQLPPVKDMWIYDTSTWLELNLHPFVFSTPYRYTDLDFFYMLLRIRVGKITEKDEAILRIRTKSNLMMQQSIKKAELSKKLDIMRPTTFYSTRKDVSELNYIEMEKLPTQICEFTSTDSVQEGKYLSEGDMRTAKAILEESAPSRITLKIGSQVMLKVNQSIECGLVNGSRGVVTDIMGNIKFPTGVMVKFVNGLKTVIDKHEYRIKHKKVIVSRFQIPLMLAYALTIHKAQGCTLDYAVINLDESVFANGQAYVALSRCRDIKGMFIGNFNPGCILTSTSSLQYSKMIDIVSSIRVGIYDYHKVRDLYVFYLKKIFMRDIAQLIIHLLFDLYA